MRLTIPAAVLLVPLLRLGGGSTAGLAAQQPDEGVLTGTVRDSASGAPVGYALVIVVGKDQQVFAGESGRFTLTGLGRGEVTLRVQQIGYRPVRITVSRTRGRATSLTVALARQAVVLPEVVVHGSVCTGVEELGADAEGGSILDEAFKNAERLLAMERSYPFRVAFQRATTILDSTRERVGGWIDTVHYDSRSLTGYRKGRVLHLNPPRGRTENAKYFTTSDLAREEFRKSHCFWYAGLDTTVEGFPGYRIEFAPRDEIRSVDWAGSFLIDSLTMRLLSSEARMVNLPPRGTTFTSATCTVFYNPIAPTLVQEFQAACVHAHRTRPPRMVVERWLLVRSAFLGRTPVDTLRR
jgi:hypothetical protein